MTRNWFLITLVAVFLFPACQKEERIPLPKIPSYTVCLSDFGGIGDGVFLNTEVFSHALAHLSERGGGVLTVPAGIWFTGPVTLPSCTELRVEKDAVIVFSTDQDLYPIIDTNFEGLDVRRCLSPINATGAHDIAITGGGIIDGNGDAWREVKRRKVSEDLWKTVLQRGGVLSEDGKTWFPDEGYQKARATAGSLNYPDPSLDENEIKTFLRPVLVSLRECERVLIEDCTFQNSPCWNLHPLWCRNVTVRNINVRNPYHSANGDGIDIEACEHVLLTGSTFDVGDDAICIKSGKDADGRRHGRPCRDLTITDCTVYHGHGGFVVGSEMSGGVDHIYMKDIVSYGVIFNLYYAGVAASEMKEGGEVATLAVDETTPEFRDCTFSDILCSGAGQAIYINGLPEMPVRNLAFRNCRFEADKGAEVHYAEGITFDEVMINGEAL